MTRGGNIEDVWKGILAADAAGLRPIKLNAVVVGGYNDEEMVNLARLTLEHPWQMRFIEMMPIGPENGLQTGQLITMHEMHARIEAALGPLTPLNAGELDGEARVYRIPGAKGNLGFISSVSEPFCSDCNRLRLTADGILRMCLLRETEVDLLTPLRAGASHEELRRMILEAIWNKPCGHGLADGEIPQNRSMNAIGG
jgi:cyclic pyranopterin phosphate synthase